MSRYISSTLLAGEKKQIFHTPPARHTVPTATERLTASHIYHLLFSQYDVKKHILSPLLD